MSLQFLFKKNSYLLAVGLMLTNVTVEPSFKKIAGSLTKELTQLSYSSKAICTLKFLIEQYKREPSLFFIQDYEREFYVILHELQLLSPGIIDYAVYTRAVCFLLRANHIRIMHQFKKTIIEAIETLNQSVTYWSVQQSSALFYFLHKHPKKWVNVQNQQDEVDYHLSVLQDVQYQYELLLGKVTRHIASISMKNEFQAVYECMAEGVSILFDAYEYKCAEINAQSSNVQPKQLFKLLHKALILQTEDEHQLLKIARYHLIPHHLERNWVRYVAAIAFVVMVARAKNDPTSHLNLFLEKHKINEYGENFANSCKRYVKHPFQRLINALFGYPIEDVGESPESLKNTVDLVEEIGNDMRDQRAHGLHEKPKDGFKIPIKILIPYTDGWAIKGTIGEKYLVGELDTNEAIQYLLYQARRVIKTFLSDVLNLSVDGDLILKVAVATPFCIAGYGGYKMVSDLYKKITFISKESLRMALLDVQQFIVEQRLQEKDACSSKELDDRECGRLTFLLYQVKKQASKALATSTYKLFLKDMRSMVAYDARWDAKQKMVDIIIERYKIG